MKKLHNQKGMALPMVLIFTTVALLGLLLVLQTLTSEFKGNSIRTEQMTATFAAEAGVEQMISFIYVDQAKVLQLESNTCILPPELTTELNGYSISIHCEINSDQLKITSTATKEEAETIKNMVTEATFELLKQGNQVQQLNIMNWETKPQNGGAS
ncbi:hypothetical protein AJ85_04795 [Alkalihalobacillus alcalophilus ATCC 27647 = CGMCC 1.3604]|uniref:Type 4 fimbrial biogenesis protein PilX N-terminal domain-containing protein n=1 Tax=Alkalihalobacillus alcalophilus ATCC 27647 = CGMCC 1.3604 TaxID=1218173 RepID=A0A094WL83_ALKAL|nr:hypothetical protein [Alkalihalobacillus alcalophilus]KGA97621.1 hypothetical protein BALCAV_0209210 [Alkalihalobacillus alcalophilus ATCC 27647 = CGMCC 1.3604]MED1561409.1 hypothetical protein [Alkalihalobacillus alcalophilus]THG91453.1 hypothetical protein AJ85_04795 [Alkalihalobacillus alcalophilus ATCC 27647 = CGMCC 1.3604]